MGKIDLTAVQAECEAELGRDGYPDGFPDLPPIPSARYADQRLYDLEIDHVWRKSWLLAAHVSDLPDPGSYVLVEKLGESIIISRGEDGAIRAMHNVCMHRGATLLTQPRGNAKRLVCPYHAWTYSLDGELTKVPEARNFACLDQAARGLTPVKCETWRGHVFINLDPDAGPLAEHLGPMPELCADFPFEQLEIKRHERVVVDCNWKVAFDNFIEIYHIATVHPAIMRWLEVKSFSVDPLKGGHSYLRTKRRNGNRIVEDEARVPDGAHDLYQSYAINLPIFPHVAGGLDAGGFSYTVFWPDGPNRTIIEIPFYGAISETDEAYWDGLVTEAMRLLGEDMELLPGVQRAMQRGRIKDVPLSYHERAIYWYHEEIDRRIGADKVPADLRVEQVLAPYAIS